MAESGHRNLLRLHEAEFTILDSLKVGVSVIDRSFTICFVNEEMVARGFRRENVVGTPCYRTYNQQLGVCAACPAVEVFRTGEKQEVIQKGTDNRYYEVIASPIAAPGGEVAYVAEITRDVTRFYLYQRRLESLYQAVDRLVGILPAVILRLTHEERVELIRDRIKELSQDLLPYDNLVVDLVDGETKRLEPLICFGAYELDDIRKLDRRVAREGGGITGYVAATGTSYLARDVKTDPRYLKGIPGASTSLTVPLRIGDRVLGTMNVESRTPGAFTEEDLKYLEIFGHFVAQALNTANLLREEGPIASVRRVAEILADRLNNALAGLVTNLYTLKQEFIQDASFLERLAVMEQEVEVISRELGSAIKLGGPCAGEPAREVRVPPIVRKAFEGRRILVAEDQENIRTALERIVTSWGFCCDAAKDGVEAIELIRRVRDYDVVLSDLEMPRASGIQVFRALREVAPETPVIFITGGLYDGQHRLTRLREEGNCFELILKPFKVSHLEKVIHQVLKAGGRAGTHA